VVCWLISDELAGVVVALWVLPLDLVTAVDFLKLLLHDGGLNSNPQLQKHNCQVRKVDQGKQVKHM
jgi:bacteriorhodopsin